MNEYPWHPNEDSCPPEEAEASNKTEQADEACEPEEGFDPTDGAPEQEAVFYLPEQDDIEPEPKKKNLGWLWPLLISLGTSVVCLSIYSVFILPHIRPATIISYVQPQAAQTQEPIGQQTEAGQNTVQAIGQRALGSVVRISNQGSIGGFFSQVISLGEGVGTIVSEDGYILTSNYIVESQGEIMVTMPDGAEYPAKVVGADPAADVAVLKIEAKGLMPMTIGDSDVVQLGDTVIAIGCALSDVITSPVTKGMICGIDKNISLQNGTTVNLLQTDAAMIADSVGGILLNAQGQMIGMVTALDKDSDEINLAMPINDIKPILESVIHSQNAPRVPELGIAGTDADYGVNVTSVTEDSPAAKAGVMVGDLIVKVDGQTVTSVAKINQIRVRHKAGDKMTLTVYRDGELTDIAVTLA